MLWNVTQAPLIDRSHPVQWMTCSWTVPPHPTLGGGTFEEVEPQPKLRLFVFHPSSGWWFIFDPGTESLSSTDLCPTGSIEWTSDNRSFWLGGGVVGLLFGRTQCQGNRHEGHGVHSFPQRSLLSVLEEWSAGVWCILSPCQKGSNTPMHCSKFGNCMQVDLIDMHHFLCLDNCGRLMMYCSDLRSRYPSLSDSVLYCTVRRKIWCIVDHGVVQVLYSTRSTPLF